LSIHNVRCWNFVGNSQFLSKNCNFLIATFLSAYFLKSRRRCTSHRHGCCCSTSRPSDDFCDTGIDLRDVISVRGPGYPAVKVVPKSRNFWGFLLRQSLGDLTFCRPFLNNGRAYGTVVVCRRRPSVRLSVCNG